MLARILVVEDEANWYDQYKDILGEEWQLDIAENFQKATALLENSAYNLILLDLCLDQPDFNSVCQRFISFLRQQHPNLPVVATTGKPLGSSELEIVFQLGDGDIVDFMQKTVLQVLDFRRRIQHAESKYPLRKKTPSNSLEYDVFISYSHKDESWVQQSLLTKLQEAEIHICIDFLNFVPGAFNLREMERAVLKSHKTLLVLTSDYFNSKWAEFEFIMAHTLYSATGEQRLIPLLLKPCELPISIRSLVYLDFTKSDNTDLQFNRLIAAIKSKDFLTSNATS